MALLSPGSPWPTAVAAGAEGREVAGIPVLDGEGVSRAD